MKLPDDANAVSEGRCTPQWLWARIDDQWRRGRVLARTPTHVIVVLPREAGLHRVHIADLRVNANSEAGRDPRRSRPA